MYESEKKFENKDFKERFEFRLTFGENETIICQRYFKIKDFNPKVYTSRELLDTIRSCARTIDEDLKEKSLIYLSYMAPRVFDTEEQMFKYFEDPEHQKEMRLGFGIVIRDGKSPNYAWGKNNKPIPVTEKFDFGEYSTETVEDKKVVYNLSFLDNGRVICSTQWEGYYPYEVRKTIDLSNNSDKILYGRQVSEINLRDYVAYKMTEGREDIVKYIISELRWVCSAEDGPELTTIEKFGKDANGREVVYDYASYAKEIDREERKAYRYLNR